VLPGPDWLTNLYLGCFIFGLIFTALSATLSFVHMPGGPDLPHASPVHTVGAHIPHVDIHVGHGHMAGHGAADGHGHTAGVPLHAGTTGDAPVPTRPVDLGARQERVSWFNMPTLLAGITWFGGVGYLLATNVPLGWTLILGAALAAGFVGSYIVYYFFAKVLWPAQTPPMDPAEYDLRGTPARVVSGIAAGGTGEIMYTKGGTRAVAGARSADGAALSKGTSVIVVRYERGLAYVLDRAALEGDSLSDEGRPTTELPPNPAISLESETSATPTQNFQP
jgi:hypothetical protein